VPRSAAHPLIGRPVAGESAYVLDGELRPVPIGVPGALYMGGDGVTRGYLHRPELTAERYVPNPYGPPGSRLYTVGDLVRVLPTGELDFLGRLDHQVKVRGFRIEPGEIEAALAAVAGVTRAAVVVREKAAGERQLVAFLAYAGGGQPAPQAALRLSLGERLPDYMVPAAFVILEALPLTPSGKLDRRALARLPIEPVPSVEDPRHRAEPRNAVEELLAGLWAEVLGLGDGRVGIEDNFFELGGDSVLGILMTARARKAGVQLTLRHLFQHQTIAALAAVAVLGSAAEPPPVAAPPAQPAAAGGAFSPADFPAAGLTQEGLDEVLAELAMD